MPPPISIVMRSKNEMPYLQGALEMLARQTYRDYELLVVDSGSTDGSVELLRKHCADGALTQIPPEKYIPGKVLNDAIARATHPIIVLLNADAVPLSDTWLESLTSPINNDQADATFCRQTARSDAHFIVTYDYERTFDPSLMKPSFFSAVACAFKRELWERHPFREKGYAEDRDWAIDCLADGAQVQYIPDTTVEHSHNYPLKELYQKRYRQALTSNEAPNTGRQFWPCSREILRDLLYACRKFKPHTIPYNLAYRITIHRATNAGLKESVQMEV